MNDPRILETESMKLGYDLVMVFGETLKLLLVSGLIVLAGSITAQPSDEKGSDPGNITYPALSPKEAIKKIEEKEEKIAPQSL